MLRLLKKGYKMISTAIALQNATQEAVHDEIIMTLAAHVHHSRNEMSDEEFAHALFQYSAALSAMTTTLVTHVLLTKSQLDEMIDTIKEMETMGKDIE
jgi:hypothetical protein